MSITPPSGFVRRHYAVNFNKYLRYKKLFSYVSRSMCVHYVMAYQELARVLSLHIIQLAQVKSEVSGRRQATGASLSLLLIRSIRCRAYTKIREDHGPGQNPLAQKESNLGSGDHFAATRLISWGG